MVMWCERLVLIVVSLLAGCCAGQWAVVKGYRVVMKADIVRDFPGMCYDVSSCSARVVNESWAIGTCSRAACEVDESGILLEVHYTCPRLQNRPSLMCDIIEEKRQPFPACCPRMICQRHKKPSPPTKTQLKPFTPHAVVDKELRKIPFVLKRFLEVQNTTLLDAIILNRIKALEAAANASVVYLERSSNASINASSITEEVPDVATTTQGPGTTTQDSTPFATTEDSVTTASPQQQTTTRPETTTATIAAAEVSSGPGFQSDSLQQQPRQNLTVIANDDDDDDDELSFLNDAPAVPSDVTTPAATPAATPATTPAATPATTPAATQAETAKTTTAEKTLGTEVIASTPAPSAAPVTESKTERVQLSTSAAPTEPTTSEVQDTTRTVALTVPESIFHTTQSPSTEQPQTTTTSAIQELKESKPPTSAKKTSSLPTILRSLVDNVFDYYDYIDYYVPGQKRNVSALTQEKGSAEERRKIPESMMDMVKEQLSKHTPKNETVSPAEADDELPQGDEPAKATPESTTVDPDDQELQKELVTKMFVDLHRVSRPDLQESTTAPTTRLVQVVTEQSTTPKAEPVTTLLPRQTERESVVPTTNSEQQVSAAQEATTSATITLVKSAVSTPQRSGLNLSVENLAAAQPEERISITPASVTTMTTSSNQETMLSSGTPPATTLLTTVTTPESTTTVTTPESTTTVTTPESTTTTATTPRATIPVEPSQQPSTTQSPTTEQATTLRPRTVPISALYEEKFQTTRTGTTKAPTTVSEAVTSTSTATTVTERTQPAEASTPAITTVITTAVTATTSAPSSSTTTPSTQAVVETLKETTAPPAVTSSQLLAGPSRNITVAPLLTTPEPTTVGVTVPATTATPQAATPTTKVPQENADTGSNLLQADQPQKNTPGTAKNQTTPTAPSHNNDVEYIDYVYYYDYVDAPDNTTTNGNGTASSRNAQPMMVKKNVTQLRA